MAQVSKQVTDRKTSSDSLVAAGTTGAPRVEAGITRLMGEPAGKAAATLVSSAIAHLAEAAKTMVAADHAHSAELADDAAPRDARDAAAAETNAAVVQVKEQLRTVAGDRFLVSVEASGDTPSDPASLERVATAMVEALQKAPAPPSRLAGYTVRPADFAALISPPLQRLRAALSQVKEEARQEDSTLSTRNAAVASYDRAFSRVANTLTALLALAGEDELARKVRPSRRKPGVTAADAGDGDGDVG